MKRKRISFFRKFLFFINSLPGFLLLLAYVFPFIRPEILGSFAALNLLTPVLILLNIFFLVYWIINLNARFFLSFLILLAGFFYLPKFYKISGRKIVLTDDIKIMSYNVRMFNKYKWIKKDSVTKKINALIAYKSPDIICLQEYARKICCFYYI